VALPSLPDVKAHLNITDDAHDAELQDMLDRAVAVLAVRIGPLVPVVVTDEVHTGPGPLVLRRYPVVSVQSATSSDSSVTDLDLDTDTGVLHGSFTSKSRATKVSYTAGRDVLPADIEAAVLEMTAHLWASQRVSRPGRPGFSEIDVNPEVPSGARFLLPYRVQTLIEPHLIPASVA
jgi:hypothetical protein